MDTKLIETQNSVPSSTASSPVLSVHSVNDEFKKPEDLRKKVRLLCESLWHHLRIQVEAEIKATRSRIFPIVIIGHNGSEERFIVQLPHVVFEIELTVAIHGHIQNELGLKTTTPKVVFNDSGFDNPLEHPYIIFTRIPGRPLRAAWPKLSREQRVTLAKGVGALYEELQSIESPYSGLFKVNTDELGRSLEGDVFLEIFGKEEPHLAEKIDWDAIKDVKDDLLTEQSLREDVPDMPAKDIALLAFKRRAFRSAIASRGWECQFANPAADVLTSIAAGGSLNDNSICLWHRDVSPKNIMVEVDTDGNPRISGLLGWEGSGFAPRFMTCRPPQWLWTRVRGKAVSFAPVPYDDSPADTKGYPEVDEEPFVTLEPTSAEAKELKKAFDEAVGKSFTAVAYDSYLIIARRLMHVAVCSVWEHNHISEVEAVLEEWKQQQLAEEFWDKGNIED
ncbi:putative Aminoglycoside phosphotransferase domain-containing protein [Seiridium unicorne]|uniref:Aminoglycoside phosphotransferase domain-containing protein n=1 Tax=Seiridium unicorne TaxID=138068 RepID=A0ABR2UFG2_9PEZI